MSNSNLVTRRVFIGWSSFVSAGVGLLARPARAVVKKPVVATGTASNINATGATVAATVNPKGSATVYRFQYGPTIAYGQASPDASAGAGNTNVAVSAILSGLTANTLYHFRISATNAGGTSVGNDATFTTQSSSGSGIWSDEWSDLW